MAKSNPFAGFDVEALKAVLDALGVQYPSDASVETLGGMVQDVEKVVGKAEFAQALAVANNTPSPAPTRRLGVRSLNPGTSGLYTDFGIGGVTVETWDPPTPLEYGRPVTT